MSVTVHPSKSVQVLESRNVGGSGWLLTLDALPKSRVFLVREDNGSGEYEEVEVCHTDPLGHVSRYIEVVPQVPTSVTAIDLSDDPDLARLVDNDIIIEIADE
jgi:hypothetical protein